MIDHLRSLTEERPTQIVILCPILLGKQFGHVGRQDTPRPDHHLIGRVDDQGDRTLEEDAGRAVSRLGTPERWLGVERRLDDPTQQLRVV